MEAINQSATPPSAQANINAIVKLEEQSRQERTTADHISDVIASFVGSIPFVTMHVIWFGIWVARESKEDILPHSEKIALLRSTVLNAKEAFGGSAKIQVKSAQPGWISLRIAPDMESRAQVVAFFRSQIESLPSDLCEKLSLAVDELLGNAIEHGCDTPYCRVEFTFIRTARMLLFHVKDAGHGFSLDDIPHAALNNPPEEPLRHVEYRSQNGMRPGGFGIMMVKQIADELMYNQHGNEVVMVKYLD